MAPISETTAYQAAHRALTDVYDAPFVHEGDPAVQRFGQAKINTRLSWNGSMRICYVSTSKLQIWRTS